MKITNVAIDRPVFISMVFVGLLVLGLMAIGELGVDLFPNTSFPLATVVTVYPGASPAEIEDRITDKIEEAVSVIADVDKVRSYSRDSVSTVVIEFDLDADAKQSVNEVRDRIATIRGELPQDIEDPIVSRIDPTAVPVLTYTVASNRSSQETRRYVDKVLRPAIERVDGVATIEIQGGAEREVQVELDRSALEAYGLTIMQVAQELRASTVDAPSGRLTLGRREEAVKASGRPEELDALAATVVKRGAGGALIRVRDVGRVIDGEKEQRTITQVNGVRSVTFNVQKQGGSNTVAVVDGVTAALAGVELPADIELTKLIDASDFIRINISHLWEHLLVGGLMAILVIYLFMLDVRSTLISSLALPTSIIATFFVMWQLDFTLNIMSMLGITLSIGILIDDSVVVRENIFRHMERGEHPVDAARNGTAEIALAVLATTLTIVAVFVPVAFTGGLVGKFFREFGLTVAAAVVISMIVSLTLDPMLSSKIAQDIPPDYHERQRRRPLIGWLVRFYEGMDRVYLGSLKWTLRHPILTVGAAAVVFFASMTLLPLMGQEFMGRGDRGEFTLQVELPAGTSLGRTQEVVGEVEAVLAQSPGHLLTATTIGPNAEVNRATMRVKFVKPEERTRGIEDIMEELRGKLAAIPGLDYTLRVAGLGDANLEEAPVTLRLQGPDYAKLAEISDELMAVLRATPGVRDAKSTYRAGSIENQLFVDRDKAADRGVSFAAVAQSLRTALEGDIVTKLRTQDDDVDARLRLAPDDRADLAGLRELSVPSAKGGLVTVAEVTRLAEEHTPATIERFNGERQISVTANVFVRSLGEVTQDLQGRLAKLDLPAGYHYSFAGESERMNETFSNLGLALGLAVLFIYLVLASQFESLIHPLTIMLALPLAIIGAVIALFVSGQPMGLASMIGMILLMGLVTKNSILLVDYTNLLRREHGKSIREALLVAGPTRLRPILMTSFAIVLGMLPAALARGEGSEFQAPMAIAVIGGVITSTFLTLAVVPVAYIWLDRLTFKGFKEWRAARREQKAAKSAAATA